MANHPSNKRQPKKPLRRDKFKGMVIGRFMANTGASYKQAEAYYDHVYRCLVRRMTAIIIQRMTRRIRLSVSSSSTSNHHNARA